MCQSTFLFYLFTTLQAFFFTYLYEDNIWSDILNAFQRNNIFLIKPKETAYFTRPGNNDGFNTSFTHINDQVCHTAQIFTIAYVDHIFISKLTKSHFGHLPVHCYCQYMLLKIECDLHSLRCHYLLAFECLYDHSRKHCSKHKCHTKCNSILHHADFLPQNSFQNKRSVINRNIISCR